MNISRVWSAAAVFNLARPTGARSWMDASNISGQAEELCALLETRAVSYVLVGGLALLAHVQGRNTEAVDLILSRPDQRRLEPEATLMDPPAPGSPFALARYKGLRVDYLDAAEPIFARVFAQHSARQEFAFASRASRKLPAATPAGLLLLKRHALPGVTRQMDWRRVGVYETDSVNRGLASPQADPRLGLRTLAAYTDEHARDSLEHEVMPDLVRRWERYRGQSKLNTA